jgi:NAD(P)H-flavin reductase
LKARGAKIEVIMGARNKELIILEDEIREFADEVYITTDDGSYGFKGMVTDKLVDLYENKNKRYDQCICIGPMIMMKFITLTAKKYGLDIVVSMNTLMVDGTGMCGACRLSVNGEIKFACVDGPEFDGYSVDFDEALNRLGQFKDEEQCAKEKCRCKGEEENE